MHIDIIGGEPTIWKHINKALLYCRLRGVHTTVFSNGLVKLKIMPSRVYLNSSQYFEKNKKERFVESLELYFKKKVRIVLRYNVEKNDSGENLDRLIELAKKYKADIHLALAVPYEINEALGAKIFEMCEKIVSFRIRCISANPIPPCMLTQKQIMWMKKNASYNSTCGIGGFPLIINPDGKTTQICLKAYLFKEIKTESISEDEMKAMYREEIETIKNKLPMEKCYQCKFFLQKKCFGGCMAPRANKLHPSS